MPKQSKFIAILLFVLVTIIASIYIVAQYDSVKLDNQLAVNLDLSHQNLSQLPLEITERDSLEVLDISNNVMTGALPSQIGRLKNLKSLDASDNLFTGIPAEIGQLTQLETLDFSNNQLTGLPYEIGKLSNLQTLDLSGNHINAVDRQRIINLLPINVVITW